MSFSLAKARSAAFEIGGRAEQGGPSIAGGPRVSGSEYHVSPSAQMVGGSQLRQSAAPHVEGSQLHQSTAPQVGGSRLHLHSSAQMVGGSQLYQSAVPQARLVGGSEPHHVATPVDSLTDTLAAIVSQQSGAAVGVFIGDGVQPIPSKVAERIWSCSGVGRE